MSNHPILGLEDEKLNDGQAAVLTGWNRRGYAGERDQAIYSQIVGREQHVEQNEIPKCHSSRYRPPWLQGLLGRKFHSSPVNGWLVPLRDGLQLGTGSLNCSGVSQAAFQGCHVLQAFHRAVDFKGEFKLLSDPSRAAGRRAG